MRSVFLLIALFFSILTFAQDSINVKVEAPKIVSKLQFGKTLEIDNVELKFIEVVTDSRCPKGVQCVWAGEAVVLVDVFKNGKKVEQKKLVFNSASRFQNELLSLFSSETLNITGYDIFPYPDQSKKIAPEDYEVQLYIKKN